MSALPMNAMERRSTTADDGHEKPRSFLQESGMENTKGNATCLAAFNSLFVKYQELPVSPDWCESILGRNFLRCESTLELFVAELRRLTLHLQKANPEIGCHQHGSARYGGAQRRDQAPKGLQDSFAGREHSNTCGNSMDLNGVGNVEDEFPQLRSWVTLTLSAHVRPSLELIQSLAASPAHEGSPSFTLLALRRATYVLCSLLRDIVVEAVPPVVKQRMTCTLSQMRMTCTRMRLRFNECTEKSAHLC
eukprot:4690221-Amphidinium_carterae.1